MVSAVAASFTRFRGEILVDHWRHKCLVVSAFLGAVVSHKVAFSVLAATGADGTLGQSQAPQTVVFTAFLRAVVSGKMPSVFWLPSPARTKFLIDDWGHKTVVVSAALRAVVGNKVAFGVLAALTRLEKLLIKLVRPNCRGPT